MNYCGRKIVFFFCEQIKRGWTHVQIRHRVVFDRELEGPHVSLGAALGGREFPLQLWQPLAVVDLLLALNEQTAGRDDGGRLTLQVDSDFVGNDRQLTPVLGQFRFSYTNA